MDWFPLYNSLRIAVISSVLVFFSGIFAAYYIAKLHPVVKGVLDVILTLPMVLPPTVVGYFILLLLGCVREWLALGSVFGIPLSRSVLPMAGMPAGGFIVLGVVCAIWRALARKRQKYLKNEARGYLAVHPQENRKEAEQ